MKHTRLLPALFIFALLALPSFAVKRSLTITAPTQAVPGAKISVIVEASTDDTEGEQVLFFHAEYSIDRGETWVGISYDQDLGGTVTRTAQITASPDSSQILVRVRACFRGGAAGDVDFNGDPIEWGKSWANWTVPAAKTVKIPVK